MLLRVFKSNHAFHFLLVPVMAALLWLPAFITPVEYPFFEGEALMPLYRPIAWLIAQNHMVNSITPLVLLITLAFLAIRLNIQYAFIRIRTFLPANLLIILTCALLPVHAMHPVYLAVFFMLFAIDRLFDSYDKEKIHANAFDAALLISLGSLFYFNLIFLLPAVWMGLRVIHKQIPWRDIFLPVLGLAIPWMFTITGYWIAGQLNDLLFVIEQSIFSPKSFSFGIDNLPMLIYLGILALIILLASFFFMAQYDEKKISSRKFFQVFFFIFIIPLILFVAVPAVSYEVFLILALPLSFLLANYLVFMKRKFWGNLIVYLLLAGAIYLQFA